MRSFSQISPTFWTRGSGKKLRGNPVAQVLALYFMTAPQSNYIGLYYNSLTSICNDTGLTCQQVKETLPLLSEIVVYDFEAEIVYLPEAVSYQLGGKLHGNDKRKAMIVNELKALGQHVYVNMFVNKYVNSFNLPKQFHQLSLKNLTQTKGLPESVEAPISFPSPSPSDLDLRTDQDQPDQVSIPMTDSEPILVADENPENFQIETVRRVFEYWKKVMKHETYKLDNKRRSRIQARLREGFTGENLRDAILGATKDDFLMGRDKGAPRKYDGIETILRDAAQVERLMELANAKRNATGGVFVQNEQDAIKIRDANEVKLQEALKLRREMAKKQAEKFDNQWKN